MTWREFQLKLAGYKREQKNKWYHTRMISYQIYTSTPIKGKHVDIEKFMKLDSKHSGLNNTQKDLLKERMAIAVQESKEKSNESRK